MPIVAIITGVLGIIGQLLPNNSEVKEVRLMIETICETILRWREMGMPPETRKEHLNSLAVGIEHLGDGNPTSMRNAADRVSRASCFGIGCSPELKKD